MDPSDTPDEGTEMGQLMGYEDGSRGGTRTTVVNADVTVENVYLTVWHKYVRTCVQCTYQVTAHLGLITKEMEKQMLYADRKVFPENKNCLL